MLRSTDAPTPRVYLFPFSRPGAQLQPVAEPRVQVVSCMTLVGCTNTWWGTAACPSHTLTTLTSFREPTSAGGRCACSSFVTARDVDNCSCSCCCCCLAFFFLLPSCAISRLRGGHDPYLPPPSSPSVVDFQVGFQMWSAHGNATDIFCLGTCPSLFEGLAPASFCLSAPSVVRRPP
jgi:hypothetical protein